MTRDEITLLFNVAETGLTVQMAWLDAKRAETAALWQMMDAANAAQQASQRKEPPSVDESRQEEQSASAGGDQVTDLAELSEGQDVATQSQPEATHAPSEPSGESKSPTD